MKSHTVPALMLAVIAGTLATGCRSCVESHVEYQWVTTTTLINGKPHISQQYQPVSVCDRYEGSE